MTRRGLREWRSGTRRLAAGEGAGPGVGASVRCSFCGKSRGDVEGIVAGQTPEIAICNECVSLCAELLGGAKPR
jgi:hypothetical protein